MEKNRLASFGEMLKECRKRQRLTQRQLAEELDVHQNTVSAWERGDYLPATRGMILEIARHLHLSDGEIQQLFDASLMTVTARWSVPHQRNPCFTGRDEILQQLHSILSSAQNTLPVRSCVLSGLCGIGKTQTAIEYAYRYFASYSAVCWINAENEDSIINSLTTLARVLQLPDHRIQELDEVAAFVLNWFSAHHSWLLIFDDVQDIEMVKRFIPSVPNGSLLFTTHLSTLGTLAHPLLLNPLSYEESMYLFLRRIRLHSQDLSSRSLNSDDEAAASAIVTALDGLPLALDQAAGYIEESYCSLTDYLHLFLHNATQILHAHPASTAYPRSVAKTFTIAFERLQEHNPDAAHLLTLCCFLAPDEIPEELFLRGASQAQPTIQAMLSDPFCLNAIFKDLLAYALLRRNAQTKTLSIHRLLQDVLRERLPEEAQRAWIEILIRMLDQAVLIEADWLDVEHWDWCEQLLPHIQRVFQLADQLACVPAHCGSLLCKTATYLYQRARFERAEQFYLRALRVQEQERGADHPDLLPMLAGVARSRLEQGDFQEVEAFYQRALAIGEAHLGQEHPCLVQSLRGLAIYYGYICQDRQSEAETLYQRALSICTKHQGATHPNVAAILNELALLYQKQGYYTWAVPLHLQSLRILEQVFEPHHPEVIEVMNSLGVLYVRQTKFQDAEYLLLRCLSLLEQNLPPDHVQMAIALNNLSRLYQEQARYALAEELYKRGLAIGEHSLKADDPFIALLLNNMAILYCHSGKYEEAQASATRALSIYQQGFPADHYYLSEPLQSLALLAYKQGNYAQAEALSLQVLSIREQSLQPDHPALAETLYLRANVRRARGASEEANLLYQRALHICQKMLGPEHLQVARILHDLATLYVPWNQWKAGQFYQQALEVWEHSPGLDHPDYVQCLEHYAEFLTHLHRETEANRYLLRAQEMRARCQATAYTTSQEPHASLRSTRTANLLCPLEGAKGNPLDDFLQERCRLSAQTSCRATELWQAYQQWTEGNGMPLSRQAFTALLKTKGCSPARTNTYRIWRGIELKDEIDLPFSSPGNQ